MPELSLILALMSVLVAYFLKGFSGFGPALVLIPALSLLINPGSAISAAALLDILAGLLLFFTVYKKIDWKFVLPVTLLLFAGAYPGAYLLKHISTALLKITIGLGLLLFIALLLLGNRDNNRGTGGKYEWMKYPIALFSGFTGGLIGITGPVLIIYLKLRHGKTYFRTQLIAIFFFGAVWRFFLYRMNAIPMDIPTNQFIFMALFLVIGLYYGHRRQMHINEKNFNRVVALVLILPALNLLINGLNQVI